MKPVTMPPEFFGEENSRHYCRMAGVFILWRQSPQSLILQSFYGFWLFVWKYN